MEKFIVEGKTGTYEFKIVDLVANSFKAPVGVYIIGGILRMPLKIVVVSSDDYYWDAPIAGQLLMLECDSNEEAERIKKDLQ